MKQQGSEGEACGERDSFPNSRSWGTYRGMDFLFNDSMACASTGRMGINSSCRTGSTLSSNGTNESRQNSLSRMSSRDLRRRASYSLPRDLGDQILESISLSRELAAQIVGNVDGSTVAQMGDSGDRVVVGGGECGSENENWRSPADYVKECENGFKSSSGDVMIMSDGILNRSSSVRMEQDKTQNLHSRSEKDEQEKLHRRVDYLLYLIHLAVFGILGIFTRYLLQRLFGPSLLALTGNDTALYLDLPSNMLGSFLMGWFGIVFKADLRSLSENLVIGLTTGYLGSLTTFSGWNQKMLDLSSKGHWTFAVAGIILGMFIVNECANVGVETAEWLHKCLLKCLDRCSEETRIKLQHLRVDSFKRHMTAMIVMLVIWGLLWGLCGALARRKLDSLSSGSVLWLGCLVGPPGVWARWYLARLNGQGLGKNGSLKWLPIGTLLANVIAATLMAALSTISNVVNTKRCSIVVTGVQFGFLGCMSTVSTFVAEVYAMRNSGHPGRALAYAILTIFPSFIIGTLIYSIPVWTKHYN
ncbi:hypothetical protein AXF42_Ash018344 [Apostasia shenzhenica]|uniref:Fluoride export protein 2 n=1 Tax=Apostasia shenzhenica TaxID=1088818 RepID=A0A2H9ZR69_9ASPA|nr:hypothetical protein AXF42_Ash018344 [Apostasia shenzhenica]